MHTYNLFSGEGGMLSFYSFGWGLCSRGGFLEENPGIKGERGRGKRNIYKPMQRILYKVTV